MSEVKEIHIKAEVEEASTDDNTEASTDNDATENKEKTIATRMREMAEGALDTVKSEVKKEIEERVSRVEKTAANLKSDVKKEVEAIVQRVREQYESEREDLLLTEIEKEVEAAVQQVHAEYKAERDRLLRTAAEAENTKKNACRPTTSDKLSSPTKGSLKEWSRCWTVWKPQLKVPLRKLK